EPARIHHSAGLAQSPWPAHMTERLHEGHAHRGQYSDALGPAAFGQCQGGRRAGIPSMEIHLFGRYARAWLITAPPLQEKHQPSYACLPTHAALKAPILQYCRRHDVLDPSERVVRAEVLFRLVIDAEQFADKIDPGNAVADAVMRHQHQFVHLTTAQPHE